MPSLRLLVVGASQGTGALTVSAASVALRFRHSLAPDSWLSIETLSAA
jgi:hypothetical protein